MKTRHALGAATLMITTLCVPAADAAVRDARLQRDVDAITALGVTGVQARVVTETGRNMVATGGVADLRTGRPVPADGHFRIASVTKAFVATVILQLAGEGRLSLDDTVDRWLPGVVAGNGNDGGAITLRQLLQHSSGIHDDYPDYTSAEDYYKHRYDNYTAAKMIRRAMRHEPDFKPGQGWRYTNTGYALLGLVIRSVTGRPWHQEVHDRIVRPLGLKHTYRPGSSPKLAVPHSRAYQRFGTDPRWVDITEQIGAANGEAGLISTTADVNRFFRALLGGRLLRPEQLAQMQRTTGISPEVDLLMPGALDGLGLFSRPLSCGGIYWSHIGGGAGFTTFDGVTADGRRSAVVSMSSSLEERVVDQAAAASKLVDDALCQ